MRSVSNDLVLACEKRLRDEKLLLKELLRNKFNTNCKTTNAAKTSNRICKPIVSQSHQSRDLITVKSWQLPSNRYNVKDIEVKPEGNKGAYISQLDRTSDTIIQHNRPRKPIGEFKFYNKPGFIDKMNGKCSKFKGVFGSTNPRDRRPSARNMITNNTFAYRSPRLGPATYFSTKKFSKQKPQQQQQSYEIPTYIFHPHSIVPIKEMEIHKHCRTFGPDPTIYYPYHSKEYVRRGIYDPNIHYKIEQNKILKFRHLPYDKKLLRVQLKSTRDDNYKITGNGHKSLFSGKKTNIPQKPNAQTKEIFDMPRIQYLSRINNPKRQTSMYRNKNVIKRPKSISFFATTKRRILKKTINTKLAFASTQSRMVNGEYKPVTIQLYENNKKYTGDEKSQKSQKSQKIKKFINSRYLDSSTKYTTDSIRKSRTFNFGNLFQKPVEKLLVPTDYWDTEFNNGALSTYLEDLSHSKFFKDSERTLPTN